MVSVSIVTYKTSLEELALCLDSLRSERVAEIFVVDNASDPAMKAFCAGRPEVTYIASANRGFGAGHNQAIRRILGRQDITAHLVLNSDVRFEPSVLDTLEDMMRKDSHLGLLQPEVVYPDGTLQYTARRLPTPLISFGRRFLPKRWMENANYRYLMKDADRSKPFEAPYFQGSFLFMRREALESVGLFDERFFMYPEDIDISRRIHERYRTLCIPSLRIIHDHRAASYHSLRMLRIHAVNMLKYYLKWGFSGK